jgi:tRNA pseudouridine13 synthase
LIVPKLEKLIGIETYATRSLGIAGIIRSDFEDFVVEEVLVDGSKAEVNPSGSNIERSVLSSSPEPNRYLLCVLVKRNWDTFSAVKAVADQLGISTKYVQVAGIKDAKALTAQHITIENVSARDIDKVHIKDIIVRPIGYTRNRLSSFYLLENHFQIIIRAIKHPKSTVKKRTASVVRELETLGGVPNFFGHQRFGTTRPITHLVGKAIIQGNFMKATMLFLAKPSPHEHPASRQAREELQATRDFKRALKDFPKQLRYERLMLKHLAKTSDDFVGALRRLPPKLVELFPQAYQSYLFNKFLSKRIEKGFPLNNAVIGDYVANVQRSGLPMLAMYRVVSAETLAEINKAVEDGKMRLAIPLVGYKQRLSQGAQGEIEKQILCEEKTKPENFRTPIMPEISLRGELRTALTPLSDFSLEQMPTGSSSSSDCKVKASFMLHRSSYATVVLRELMKPRNPIRAGF